MLLLIALRMIFPPPAGHEPEMQDERFVHAMEQLKGLILVAVEMVVRALQSLR